MAAPLPTLEAVTDLVGGLVGKRPKVTKVAPLAATAVYGVASYVDGGVILRYAAAVDLAFIASVGAALALIPPGVVQEALAAKKPQDSLLENAHEVLNVAASLFNAIPMTDLHVKITQLDTLPGLSKEILQRIAKPAARLDCDVAIPGYPQGRLSLLSLA